MVNFRNVIVHGYFGIDEDEVWDIIVDKLDMLANDISLICKKNIDLNAAIKSQIVDFEKLKDNETVAYLKGLLTTKT